LCYQTRSVTNARTLDIKTITDKTASQAITQFGLERKLDLWKKPLKVFKDLRQLTRERGQMIAERTLLKNQLHAEQAEAVPNYSSINRVNERISLLDKQEKEILVELAIIVQQEKTLARTGEKYYHYTRSREINSCNCTCRNQWVRTDPK